MIDSLILVRHDPVDFPGLKGRLDLEPTEKVETEILWKPDAVYSSPLKRAKMKAESLFVCHGIEIAEELNNIDRGELEGLAKEEVMEEYPEFWSDYKRDKLSARFPGGESYNDVFRRVGKFLSGLSGNVAIVAHGATLRAAMAWIGVPPEVAVHYFFKAGIAVHWRREWGVPDEIDKRGMELNKSVKLVLSNGYCEMLHKPVRTSPEASAIRNNSMDEGVKSIIVKSDGEFFSVLVPASRKVKWNPLKKRIGKVRMASPEEVVSVVGARPGGVPPIGHGLKIFYSPDIIKPVVYFNAGLKSSSIKSTGKQLEMTLHKEGAEMLEGI